MMLLWIAGGALFAVCLQRAMSWRGRAKKGLILATLLRRGEQTGMQLREAGVGGGTLYIHLYELEQEGLIVSRELGDERPERPKQRAYRIKERP